MRPKVKSIGNTPVTEQYVDCRITLGILEGLSLKTALVWGSISPPEFDLENSMIGLPPEFDWDEVHTLLLP